MNSLDERARRAATSARRLAGTVDAEQVLARIEGPARAGRRWVVPAVVLGSAAAIVVGAVALTGALTVDDPLRIDDPGIIDQPAGDWPPSGHEAEDGWIEVDPRIHGIEGLPADVVVFDGDFLLLDTIGRIWRSGDGLTWEQRAELNLDNGDLVVDRGRVVAMGLVDDGRQMRVLWTENGDDWSAADARANPALAAVGADEQRWFDPQLVAGPRGFLIAASVWVEQPEPSGSATGPANAGATIRVLESADGAEWRMTQEWAHTGTADLIGVAGDTNGYTLVFEGDGGSRAYASGDGDWVELTDHPGTRPIRLVRSEPVPLVGDGPEGDGLGVPAVALHTWEFAVTEPAEGSEVMLRTGGGSWEPVTFEGPSVEAAGWHVTAIVDAPDALYAHVSTRVEGGSLDAIYRSEDGSLWTELPREPVFADSVLAGNEVVTATHDRTSVLALACCEPGRIDGDTRLSLFVRRAPAGSSDDPDSAGPGTAPTSWEQVRDPDFDAQPVSMLMDVETLGGRLIAFGWHLEPSGDGGYSSAGANVWLSDDGMEWRRTVPDALAGVGKDLIDTAVAGDVLHALIETAAGPELWSSHDGETWDQLPALPDTVRGSAADFRPTALAVAPSGPVVVGRRTFGGDGVSYTDTQPLAAVFTEDGWVAETLGPQGRNVFVHDVAIVGGEPVAVGGIDPADGSEPEGRVWMREGRGSWTAVSVENARVLDLVTTTETGWLATSVGSGEPLTVVRGLAGDRERIATETVDGEGVMVFDLVTVDGAALGTGNTNSGGPNSRTAVVRFGLEAGAEVTWISESGGEARGITRAGSTLYVVGEAVDRADDGQGYVTRSGVWRGPLGAPTAPVQASCGAEGMSGEPEPQPGLPDAVQTMRVEIASALVRCDHGLLAELARAGSGDFTASFGGVDDLAAWFAEQDLRQFRLLLDLPYASTTAGDGVTYYAWPSAFVESTDEAWQALYDAGLATPEDRAEMEEAFDGWVGFRHGITADGDWVFTVAGD